MPVELNKQSQFTQQTPGVAVQSLSAETSIYIRTPVYKKVLMLIPVLGTFVQLHTTEKNYREIQKTDCRDKKIAPLKDMKQVAKIGITRNMLIIAGLVGLIALNVIGPGFGLLITFAGIGVLMGLRRYGYCSASIQELQRK